MLAVLGAQATTGLFATDDISIFGPLNHLVDEATAKLITGIHTFLYSVTITVVGIHVLAIVGYRVIGGQNLFHPMIHGYKIGTGAEHQALLAGRGLATAAIVGVIVYVVL